MKLDWGKGIFIAMALFMAFIVIMAVKMMNSNQSLYEEDYYEIGENHSERMEEQKNGNLVQWRLDATKSELSISFDSIGSISTVRLVNLADESKDIKITLESKAQAQETKVSLPPLSQGIWMVELAGNVNTLPFFIKEQKTL